MDGVKRSSLSLEDSTQSITNYASEPLHRTQRPPELVGLFQVREKCCQALVGSGGVGRKGDKTLFAWKSVNLTFTIKFKCVENSLQTEKFRRIANSIYWQITSKSRVFVQKSSPTPCSPTVLVENETALPS